MSDSDEVADGMALAIGEAQKLYAKDQNHELLRIWGGPDEIWEEFQTRFGKPGITKKVRASYNAQAYFWGQYFLALKAENERLGSSVSTSV